MNDYITTWLALAVVGLIASLSAGLGLLLYRSSAAVLDQKIVRLAGAAAIAWLFFLGMGRLYINVLPNLQQQQVDSQQRDADALARAGADVTERGKAYKDCALHAGDFQCKEPADQLLRACNDLSSGAQ